MRFVTILTLLALAAPAYAHNFDNYSLAVMQHDFAHGHKAKAAVTASTYYYPVILEINSDDAITLLEDAGAVIFHRRANFVLADVPNTAIDVLDNSEFIDAAAIAKATCSTVDVARDFANITAAHSGDGVIAGYDGTGVIAGLCDIGFDPSHIAFKDKVGLISTYKDYEATRSVYAPHSALATTSEMPQSDNNKEFHGTHTANIMAGGRDNNPYYGAAPGAELAVSRSELSEMGLLCGIEDILAYAKEQEKPVAINLSVGSYLGPHDGTDLVNRYLDLVGKEAPICFSAGNNGAQHYSIQHDFTEERPTLGSIIESTSWNGFDIEGAMDFWSSDSRKFDLQLVIYDLVNSKYIYESDWINSGDEGTFTLSTDGDVKEWNESFTDSHITVTYGTDEHNGRYNVMMAYTINSAEEQNGHHWARFVCGWRIKAEPGVHVDGYADGSKTFFRRYGVDGMSDGNGVFSISNLCCNHSVISVGSCNSRNTTPVVDSDDKTYDFTVGTASSFSSRGTTLDGRVLPLICAPGNMIVSATSPAFLTTYPDKYAQAYTVTVDSQTYAWHAECGTSMASPLAAGIIAVWLQAVPTLTVDEIKEAIVETAQTDYSDITDSRWGAGCIDAAAGLKYLIDKSSVIARPAETDDGGNAVYYTLQGVRLKGAPTAPGIYIARTATSARKVAVKN
jgi:hypothetical protein